MYLDSTTHLALHRAKQRELLTQAEHHRRATAAQRSPAGRPHSGRRFVFGRWRPARADRLWFGAG